MKTLRSFGFIASILRAGVKTTRQGYINAGDELEAIDRVYNMGKTVWERLVIEVTILGGDDNEILATSKVGERVQPNLLGAKDQVKDAVKKATNDDNADKPEKRQAGFVPWSELHANWYPSQFGRVFTPQTFGRLTNYK